MVKILNKSKAQIINQTGFGLEEKSLNTGDNFTEWIILN